MNEIKITIEGLQDLTAAINRLAGQHSPAGITPAPAGQAQGVPAVPVQTAPAPAPAPFQAGQPAGVSVPVQPQPYQAAVPPAPFQPTPVPQQPGPLPTTAVATGYTYDQLAVAAAGLVNQGKQQQLHEILQSFGVVAMTDIPKERYGEFAAAMKAKGAVI